VSAALAVVFEAVDDATAARIANDGVKMPPQPHVAHEQLQLHVMTPPVVPIVGVFTGLQDIGLPLGLVMKFIMFRWDG